MSKFLASTKSVDTQKPPGLKIPGLLHIYISDFIPDVDRDVVLALTTIAAGLMEAA